MSHFLHQVEKDLKTVMNSCGGTAAGAAAAAAAKAALDGAKYIANKLINVAEESVQWAKNHPGAIVGTIVIIGGVTFVVATGGAGAIVLDLKQAYCGL